MPDFGRYTLVRKIGRGGMAEIWKAQATGPSGFVKDLALKTILPDIADDRVFVSMFVDEAKLAASLIHPNLVQVFDFGETDGRLFLAMEYVAGANVDRLLARLHKAKQSLPTDVAIYIAHEVCRGLGYAHDKMGADGNPLGIVHRDVSPQNILVSASGDVKLGDFGIAKAASAIPRTAAGHVRGKLAYMSPEQLTNRTVDGRSDLFSLGVVLWELLTGNRLFSGASGDDVYEQVRTFDPMANLDLAKVPDEIRDVLVVVLQHDASDRYRHAQQLELELGKRLGIEGLAVAKAALGELVRSHFADDEAAVDGAPTTLEKKGARGSRSADELTVAQTPSASRSRQVPAAPVRRRRWPYVAAGLAVLVGGGGFAAWRLTSAPASGHPRGGVVRLGIGFPAQDYDVYSVEWSRTRMVMVQVIEPLFRVSSDGEIVPSVIDRAEAIGGGKQVVLHLRDGVYFHDHPCLAGGKLATGEDVAFSLRSALKHARVPLQITDTAVAGNTVTLTLAAPSPFYEAQLADVPFLPRELDGCDDVRRMKQPVGTGPFRFDGAPKSLHMRLVRAPRYWGRDDDGSELPYLDGFEVEQIDELSESLSKVARDQLDVVMPSVDVWPRMFDDTHEPARLKAPFDTLGLDLGVHTSHNRVALLGVFAGKADGPLHDPRVRGALARALDRPALAAVSVNVLSGPTGRFLDSRMLGFDGNVPELGLDPTRAEALLAEAGHAHGDGLAPIKIGTVRETALANLLAAQAAKIGLRVEVVTVQPAAILDALASGSVDGMIVTDITGMRGGEHSEIVTDLTRVTSSPELTALQRQLAATPVRGDRAPIYKQIEQTLLAQLPVIPIAWGKQAAPLEVYLVGKRVKGFADGITGYARLENLARAWLAR